VIDDTEISSANLQIWQDLNSDGITDSGELISLAALDIVEIDLNTTSQNTDAFGSLITETSVFLYGDETEGDWGEVSFDIDPNEGESYSSASAGGDPNIPLV